MCQKIHTINSSSAGWIADNTFSVGRHCRGESRSFALTRNIKMKKFNIQMTRKFLDQFFKTKIYIYILPRHFIKYRILRIACNIYVGNLYNIQTEIGNLWLKRTGFVKREIRILQLADKRQKRFYNNFF